MKLENTVTGIYLLLKKMCGNECLLCAWVFEWLKHFDDGWDLKEHSSLGCPSMSNVDESIEKVCNLIQFDHQLTLYMIAETVWIGKEGFKVNFT